MSVRRNTWLSQSAASASILGSALVTDSRPSAARGVDGCCAGPLEAVAATTVHNGHEELNDELMLSDTNEVHNAVTVGI